MRAATGRSRGAETELYDAYWSDRILDEVVRNRIADGRATRTEADNLIDAIANAFNGAAVPQEAIDRLEPAMTSDGKSRHVLAAAVVSRAQAVVTLNLRDFPPTACEPFAVDALHPDAFPLDLLNLGPQQVFEAVERQAAVLRRPPISLDGLLQRLAVTVLHFAAALRRELPAV